MEQSQIASFIVRFHLLDIDEETREKKLRIKVTHVQDDTESFFDSLDDAALYMKSIIEGK